MKLRDRETAPLLKVLTSALILFTSLVTSDVLAANARSSEKKAPQRSRTAPVFTACNESLSTFRAELERVDHTTKEWANHSTQQALVSERLKQTRKGRMTELFAAHILDKAGRPLVAFAVECWLNYVNFREAVHRGEIDEAIFQMNEWNSCLSRDGQTPYPKALNLIACWRNVSNLEKEVSH